MTRKSSKKSIVMLGASGAVGTETLSTLLQHKDIKQLTLLGRHQIPKMNIDFIQQHKIGISDTSSYKKYLDGHTIAICTLGVGEPSKMSKAEFVKIDKVAVLDFAQECKHAGIKHFELLSSVGINPKSKSFFLRTKAELVEALKDLQFERLSIFQPSMILTRTNRYGLAQAITLKVWPLLNPIFSGRLRKYRGVKVNILGQAIAENVFNGSEGFEILQWDDFETV